MSSISPDITPVKPPNNGGLLKLKLLAASVLFAGALLFTRGMLNNSSNQNPLGGDLIGNPTLTGGTESGLNDLSLHLNPEPIDTLATVIPGDFGSETIDIEMPVPLEDNDIGLPISLHDPGIGLPENVMAVSFETVEGKTPLEIIRGERATELGETNDIVISPDGYQYILKRTARAIEIYADPSSDEDPVAGKNFHLTAGLTDKYNGTLSIVYNLKTVDPKTGQRHMGMDASAFVLASIEYFEQILGYKPPVLIQLASKYIDNNTPSRGYQLIENITGMPLPVAHEQGAITGEVLSQIPGIQWIGRLGYSPTGTRIEHYPASFADEPDQIIYTIESRWNPQ